MLCFATDLLRNVFPFVRIPCFHSGHPCVEITGDLRPTSSLRNTVVKTPPRSLVQSRSSSTRSRENAPVTLLNQFMRNYFIDFLPVRAATGNASSCAVAVATLEKSWKGFLPGFLHHSRYWVALRSKSIWPRVLGLFLVRTNWECQLKGPIRGADLLKASWCGFAPIQNCTAGSNLPLDESGSRK